MDSWSNVGEKRRKIFREIKEKKSNLLIWGMFRAAQFSSGSIKRFPEVKKGLDIVVKDEAALQFQHPGDEMKKPRVGVLQRRRRRGVVTKRIHTHTCIPKQKHKNRDSAKRGRWSPQSEERRKRAVTCHTTHREEGKAGRDRGEDFFGFVFLCSLYIFGVA